MYRDRFQSHRWTTTVYEGVEEQSGKKQSVTASRLPFVREEKGGGRRTSGWGEADKSWTGWTTKPFICLRFICVRAKGTRTRRLRLPTCRGTRHATNNDRPNKCKNPSSPHCFSPILLSTQPTRCLIQNDDGFHFDRNRAFEREAIKAGDEPRNPTSKYIQPLEGRTKRRVARFRRFSNKYFRSSVLIQ